MAKCTAAGQQSLREMEQAIGVAMENLQVRKGGGPPSVTNPLCHIPYYHQFSLFSPLTKTRWYCSTIAVSHPSRFSVCKRNLHSRTHTEPGAHACVVLPPSQVATIFIRFDTRSLKDVPVRIIALFGHKPCHVGPYLLWILSAGGLFCCISGMVVALYLNHLPCPYMVIIDLSFPNESRFPPPSRSLSPSTVTWFSWSTQHCRSKSRSSPLSEPPAGSPPPTPTNASLTEHYPCS